MINQEIIKKIMANLTYQHLRLFALSNRHDNEASFWAFFNLAERYYEIVGAMSINEASKYHEDFTEISTLLRLYANPKGISARIGATNYIAANIHYYGVVRLLQIWQKSKLSPPTDIVHDVYGTEKNREKFFWGSNVLTLVRNDSLIQSALREFQETGNSSHLPIVSDMLIDLVMNSSIEGLKEDDGLIAHLRQAKHYKGCHAVRLLIKGNP